ncbi:hypothetical protein QBC37DRAFT_428009 [Rhypophila decipiens]|uniref:F-box domain-containing protein n=1 Tax=Rhypophila decipiens TaxID=261697 RepID=A0AAN6Y427_9PEZI|nr:hypothetical protein QBC37DRAFT_428009 [Rhypophila decipiens]
MAPITSLAPELLQRIVDVSDPPDHLNLALTSKTLHNRLNCILLHSQACHRKYHAVSDIQPSTIPDLLRAILFKDDRIAAWHIRAIEIWGFRAGFADWKPYHLVVPKKSKHPAEEGGPGVVYQDGYFTDAEITAFREAMIDLFKLPDVFELKRPELPDEHEARSFDLDKVMDDLQHGNTAFLAVLLMAVSPRLEAIRFVRNAHVDWRPCVLALADVIDNGDFPAPVRIAPLTREEKQKENDPHRYDSDDVERDEDDEETEEVEEDEKEDLRQEVQDSYPPGFLSVKEIAVGLVSKTQDTRIAGSAGALDMKYIGPLLHLPRLKSLWVHGFWDGTDDVEDGAAHWKLPVGCSSAENLVFDCPDQPQREPLRAVIQACGKLKHLTFIDGAIGDNIDCDHVLEWCEIPRDGECLKSVLWCGTGVHGYRSAMFYPNEIAGGFDILTISTDDLILCGVEFPTNEDPPPKQLDGFAEYLFETLAGDDARVLVTHDLWGCSEDLLEQALIMAVRRECWGECWERNIDECECCGIDHSKGDVGRNEDSDAEEHQNESDAGGDEIEGKPDKNEDANEEEELQPKDRGEMTHISEDGEAKLTCGCLPSWGNHGRYPHFPQPFTALYLEDIDPWTNLLDPLGSEGRQTQDANAPPRDPTKRPFGELIKWCKLWGVEIHTRTTPAPRIHNVAMPTIASEKDLQTSPWYKHPDVEKLYFKPHKGMVRDCGNCGECKKCYKRHPPECWAKWKEDDAQAEEQRRKWEAEEQAAETESEDEGAVEDDKSQMDLEDDQDSG